MDDHLEPRSEQERLADQLYEALAATAGDLAKRAPHQKSTAAPQEQVEVGKALMIQARWLPTFVARIVLGHVKPSEWTNLGRDLEALAASCRRQGERGTVIDAPEPDEAPPG